ncbi:TlpA disulfide reductase family protein [Flavivirga algicola]|uniref:AhpC/TSA family protein n=1 Tax=Flavivirga algicola TaxID=2729136 RepID=A0ABX1RY88_9FLAO|nr:TlpA disulfide reductase family protein [Flavivirga algicola]NMH87382.1 AhpC/TSA family protein [Flavivirga algicola]
MKHILILFICFIFACKPKVKNENNQGYTVEGKVTNIKDSTVLLLYSIKLNKAIDSVYVINGEFNLSGTIEQPEEFMLSTKLDPKNKNYFKYIFFWLENTKLNLEGDLDNFRYAKINGSKLNDILYEQTTKKRAFYEKRDSLVNILGSGKRSETLLKQLRDIDSITDKIDLNFIRTQPNNRVALKSLTFLKDTFSKEELSNIYNSLDETLKQSDDGKSIGTYLSINKILEQGDYIKDIVGSDLQNQSKTLASIVKQNKYTILDFWAAGCGPCRKQSKQYAELYKKYHSQGLEIVSFSLDKNRKNWESASKKDNITWVNISDLKGNNAKTPMTYGIKGIPNSFLINQEGKIVSEFYGYNPEKLPFEKELESFFSTESSIE